MSDVTLTTFTRQYIETRPVRSTGVQFNWQGGEPTLAGLDFYKRARDVQRSLLPAGTTCTNTLQTHGLRLDDKWAAFFKTEGFLVGLSLDGPLHLHDLHRVDARGNGTGERALAALNLLRNYDVPFNVLVVVHRDNADHPTAVYDFLVRHGVTYIQFVPLVIPNHAAGADRDPVLPPSVRSEQYGAFLCAVFDRWLERDVGRVFVQGFENALAAWVGAQPALCTSRRTCGQAVALEHNGDVFACDHFVDARHRLGNIHHTHLAELAASPGQIAFGQAKAELPAVCRHCDVLFACRGECPKNRVLKTSGEPRAHNYLCAGLRQFFRHAAGPMRAMSAQVRQGQPVSAAHNTLTAPPLPQQAHPRSRNASCPCGSGRKYKHCCGRTDRSRRPTCASALGPPGGPT